MDKVTINLGVKKEYIPHKCPYCEKLQYYQGDKRSFIYGSGKYYCYKCFGKRREKKNV